jgi:co-chaperonin GroES (HSP10)
MQTISGDVTPLRNHVLVENMDVGEKLVNGIIRLDDNGRDTGVRPRWAKVYAVGANITDIHPGNWVLVEHGQWTYRVKVQTSEGEKDIQRIKYPEGVLVVADENPEGV